VLPPGVSNRAIARWWGMGWGFQETFGTESTTAPVATVSPQTEMIRELRGEVALLKNAQVLAAWLQARVAAGTGASFTAGDVFADKKTVKKLSPKVKEADDILPTLELMAYYGVVAKGAAGFTPKLGPDGAVDAKRLDEAATSIGTFTTSFEKRYPAKGAKKPVVVKTEIKPEWSSDLKQRAAEDTAENHIKDLRAQLGEFIAVLTPVKGKPRPPVLRVKSDKLDTTKKNPKKGGADLVEVPVVKGKSRWLPSDEIALVENVQTGTDPATVKRRTELEGAIAKAEAELPGKREYRRFALEVGEFLERLWGRNKTWRAGTYASHSWGEFSVDIFLQTSIYKDGDVAPGFWKRDVARQFFADLNATAEEEGKWGKFAWRALYNDDPLAAEMNRMYGAGRVLHVENHGPAPDHKLHIHLDVRPVKVVKDIVTGYDIKDGRVVLN
jgi:hypothetical protein